MALFLNHFPDSPNHPDASYRVFESRWKEVYLLWLGQDKILRKDKEYALSLLITFNDACDELYKYKAFVMAALGIAEFGSYSQAESIIKQIVNWYFGYIEFQLDNELTVTFHSSMTIDNLVKTALEETNRQSLIKYLSKLANTSSYESTRRDAVRCLREIGYNDWEVIQAMIELTSNTDKQVRQKAIEYLGEIGKGKSEVINTLNSYLLDADEEEQFKIAKELGKIDIDNKNVIQILMSNLLACDDSYDSRQIAYIIQKVDINNECCQILKNLLQNVEEDSAGSIPLFI
ncbi:HEAT repeat domain-containing protein [Chamaesiphon sp. OTE_8_metabat_110]|uniref:HEAT repeat domain-containing protein n=1 Tax=Chamaesiphon sp. OTE_8_metabat_110 TaxID=2964696 RepID=UPI00286C1327|nr:HEAT repeat domain-containing protein [Chamaesiphon sp. OTE_8_metabat_110]